ncbi:MAG: hypothetical protein C6P35_03305 [Cohnella sp.]|uniref:phage distal tail protein n=1 Tax=Cohnella sp. TaxID=1883426 RepID=UPI000E37B9C8|nr:hypothetical protein [Cohnella sp.]REK68010.1 MAG: hypothetical protein C6P35_03305 [Cohnella sp.]
MFNRSFFNRATYNRLYTVEVFFSATMAGEGFMTASPSAEYAATITMSGEGELTADFIREIAAKAAMVGEGELTAEFIREMAFGAKMDGEGFLRANGSRFHVESITVTGPFEPGDKIVIDSGKMIVRKNGAIVGYDGDFFDISPGGNKLIYSDTASGRTILCRITYRDKYV